MAGGTAAASGLAWQRPWVLVLLLLAGAFLAYLPIWHAGFIWDDDAFLTENPLIRLPGGLYRIWCTTAAPDYFPVTSTALWLEWRLWGAKPLGYHLINVLLHAASALLWWRVLARLKVPGAWLAAAVFAVHPVNVESVAWVTERKNTLAMFFYALSLLGYLGFEDTGRRRWYGVALGAFMLALLSKTAPAPLPLVLLGLAWWRRGRVEHRDLWRSVPFFAVALVLGLVTIWFQYHRSIGTEIVRADTFVARVAGAGWAVWFYLWKAMLPVNLMFVYPRWHIATTNLLSFVPGLLVVAGFVVCWFYRRQWGKPVLVALGYFVLMLLPVLGFLNISFFRYSLVADHWQYFAILGPIALLVAGVLAALRRWQGNLPPLVQGSAAGLLLVMLGALTWRQCGMYQDMETLWRRTIDQNPKAVLAYHNLGFVLLQKGNLDDGIGYLREALALDPGLVEAHYNLGKALLQRNQPDAAIAEFRAALDIQPDHAFARNNLAMTLLQKGQSQEAYAQFQAVLEKHPDDALAHFNLGNFLYDRGQLDEAIQHFQKAVDAQPRFAAAQNALGNALLALARVDEAVAHLQKALEVVPNYVSAFNNLAHASWIWATCPLPTVRNGPKALALAQQLDQATRGQNLQALGSLAAAYAEVGRYAEAVAAAEHGLQLANAQGNAAIARAFQEDLPYYQAGQPYRDLAQTNRPVFRVITNPQDAPKAAK